MKRGCRRLAPEIHTLLHLPAVVMPRLGPYCLPVLTKFDPGSASEHSFYAVMPFYQVAGAHICEQVISG